MYNHKHTNHRRDGVTTRNQYLAVILSALGLEEDMFWEALLRKERYAVALYLWIDKLYSSGNSVVRATRVLFKARNMYYHKKMKSQYGKIS